MDQQDSNELLQRYRKSGMEKFDSLSDEALIVKIIEGHAALYEIIIKRYNQQLFRIIRGYLSNKNDVQDVMQSTYLKAFENLEQFRAEARLSTWLIRIGINEALKKIKSQTHISEQNPVTHADNSNPINGIEAATPETNAIRKDMNKQLEQAIDTLPPKYRSVLIMREIEQMSTRETAESLDITRVNVKVRLHRAKKMLRDQLEKTLSDMDLFSFRGAECDAMTEQVMKLIERETQTRNQPGAG